MTSLSPSSPRSKAVSSSPRSSATPVPSKPPSTPSSNSPASAAATRQQTARSPGPKSHGNPTPERAGTKARTARRQRARKKIPSTSGLVKDDHVHPVAAQNDQSVRADSHSAKQRLPCISAAMRALSESRVGYAP